MKKTIGKGIRPIFIPVYTNNKPGVIEKQITFDWHMGMSPQVKKRSIESLHEQAAKVGFVKILEASSKSSNNLGINLSAFFLKNKDSYPVENLFQSSKVFEEGGPFLDLLSVIPREAKRDKRLKNSGNLIKFTYDHEDYPLEPKSLFYDWLYVKVLNDDCNIKIREALINENFDAYSDIEFNPKKSFSCQARTLALFVSLYKTELVKEFIENPIEISKKYNLYEQAKIAKSQRKLF